MAAYNIRGIYDFRGGEYDKMIILGIAGFFSGIISGMGIGGGTILIPALIFFGEMSQQQAQSINIIYFVPTAVVALIRHKKDGNIEVKTVKTIVAWGIIGAAAGAVIATSIDSDSLKKLFGIFLLVMGIMEIFKKKKEE